MSARRKLRPPVPGRFSNHVDSGGSRDGAVSWGAYNLRARKISRQTTQAISTDTDTLSDSDSLYTPGNDRQKSIPNISHQSLSSSLSSSSQLLKDDAQKITPVIETVPTISNRNTRKKWTSEMNEFILRTYLYLTMMDTDTKGYLQPLHMKFIERFPDMQVTRQRIGDQRRAIMNNKLLPQEIVNQIYNEVQSNLQTTFAQSISVTQNNQHTNTHPLQTQQRMKWTDEYNEAIIRIYYKITQCEKNKIAYRKLLHQEFINQFPHLSHLTEQRIADQRRLILHKKYLSVDRLELIKNDLQEQHNDIQANDNSILQIGITDNEEPDTESLDLNAENHTTNENENLHREKIIAIDEMFAKALEYFANTNPTERQFIPKQRSSKKLSKIVAYVNNILLPQYINSEIEFKTFQNLVYCAAWTSAKLNGAKIEIAIQVDNPLGPEKQKKYNKPKWEQRLENKVSELRAKIARLTQYINGNRGQKLIKHVNSILEQHKIHSVHEEHNTKHEHFLDTLKQKLKLTSSRLKRYRACTLRKTQNILFCSNEKLFYRNIKNPFKNKISSLKSSENNILPSPRELQSYWSTIWEEPKHYNTEADWIKNQIDTSQIKAMQFQHIKIDTFHKVIKKLHNWKTPGSDNIHNYWYKKFTTIHPILFNFVNKFIQSPHTLPQYISSGITYMIPKEPSNLDNPAKYRPITCLQTLYKIITSCLTETIYEHIEANNILSEEQKGCRKFSQGCKEQLTIDAVVLKQVQSKRKDLFSMYIDYKKAYDSIPHTWLLKILEIYKIHPNIIQFLQAAMTNWTTKLKINSLDGMIETDIIAIRRGIFQGDALSPLWFCLAINPLSQMLNSKNIGYSLQYHRTQDHLHTNKEEKKLSHLLYMDDLKLYATTQDELDQLVILTEKFSRDIGMEFGIDKCNINSVRAGQYYEHNYQLQTGQQIKSLEENGVYKYLGYNQSKQIHHKEIKNTLTDQFRYRLRLVLTSQLNSKNIFKAINTFAIPILTYSFGIIHWSKTELKKLQREINTSLTRHRKHHPRSCIQRLTLPRNEGGRGVIDIVNLHNRQITTLRNYFYDKTAISSLHNAIVQNDHKLTPLNMHDKTLQKNELLTDNNTKIDIWTQKSLHGRHRHDLNQPTVDKLASNAWLQRGELFPETEGFMCAIQDQIIETRNYQKHIIKIKNLHTDTCRRCCNASETIQHITGACKAIVQTDYKYRHDQVANIIHQKLAFKYKLTDQPTQVYYKYKPEIVLENTTHKMYFDRAILTDKTIHFNRPDITLIDKANKCALIIDIAIPNSHNLQTTINEKISKYTELKHEIIRMWNLHNAIIVPIVLSTTGVIPKALHQSLKTLDLPKLTYIQLQKAVLLNTCRIVRKFISTENYP